jgi:hypothetical protein
VVRASATTARGRSVGETSAATPQRFPSSRPTAYVTAFSSARLVAVSATSEVADIRAADKRGRRDATPLEGEMWGGLHVEREPHGATPTPSRSSQRLGLMPMIKAGHL